MENNLSEIMKDEKQLYAALTYFRLTEDFSILEEKMDNNKPVEEKEEDNAFVKAWNKNIVNPLRKNNSDRISANKKKVLDEIDKFKKNNPDESYLSYGDEEALKSLASTIYNDDKYGMAKTYLAIRFALDNEYSYVNETETMKKVSKVLFDDEDKLASLKAKVLANYLEINRRNLTDVEKGVLVSLGIISAVSLCVMPLSVVSFGLAEASAVTLVGSAIMLCGTLTAIQIREIFEDEKLIKAFENVSPEEISLIFAIKVSVIEEIKDKMDINDLKEELDSCLKIQDELRSDAEYMLIVEKVDAANYKRKISSCNNMSNRLATVMGI